jgi:thiamine-phosphate pyrophosphorylase
VSLPAPPLLLITDRLSCRGKVEDVVAAALRGGCRWVMVREKDLDHDALVALARRIVADAARIGATVVVSGDAAAAVEAGAAGVHLPQGGSVAEARRVAGAGALVGVSCHSESELHAAARDGADYATLSPVFPTESKPEYGPALGLAAFARLVRPARLPVLALGGVGAANAAACRRAGAAGIAVMGGVMRATDPERALAAMIAALDSGSR